MTKGVPFTNSHNDFRNSRASFPGFELNIYDLVFHRCEAGVDSVSRFDVCV